MSCNPIRSSIRRPIAWAAIVASLIVCRATHAGLQKADTLSGISAVPAACQSLITLASDHEPSGIAFANSADGAMSPAISYAADVKLYDPIMQQSNALSFDDVSPVAAAQTTVTEPPGVVPVPPALFLAPLGIVVGFRARRWAIGR